MHIREIAEQVYKIIIDNDDTILLEQLMDNKMVIRRLAGYRMLRQDKNCNYYWTAIHAAAAYGRLGVLKLFHVCGCMMDMLDEKKRLALWYAAAYNHIHVLTWLVEIGLKPKYRDNDNWTPLHIAARNGHCNIVQFLLAEGGCQTLINEVDNCGFSILHKAVWGGHYSMVHYLIQVAKSDPYIASTQGGILPLHIAASTGDSKILESLLDAIGDEYANVVDRQGLTALMIAARNGDMQSVNVLLNHNADCTIRTQNGWNVVHMCVDGDSDEVLEKLIHHVFHENLPSSMKTSRSIDTERFLLSNIFCTVNKDNWSPILLASFLGRSRMIQMLQLCIPMAENFKPTLKGFTALHLAVQSGKLETFIHLLASVRRHLLLHFRQWVLSSTRGAPFSMGNRVFDFDDMENKLLSSPSKSPKAKINFEKIVEKVFQFFFPHSVRTGQTPLHVAAQCNNYHSAEVLFYTCETVLLGDFVEITQMSNTMIYSPDPRVYRQLLINKVLNVMDQNGKSALHLATALRHMEIIRLLLRHGGSFTHAARTVLSLLWPFKTGTHSATSITF